MNGLNVEQRQAVDALSAANVAVIAGPGSGKTHTLARAVQSVTAGRRSNIVCLTFTTKAAENLRLRIGDDSSYIFIGTFHALAHKLLGKKIETLRILGNDDTLLVLNELKRSRSLTGLNVAELGLHISRAKNGSLRSVALQELVNAYNALLADRGLLDYDDLILRCIEHVSEQSTTYEYVFVDEFQDTSPRQYELLRKITNDNTRVFAIGDPNQSIYKFRGADGSVFVRYHKDFQSKTLSLTTNYRSTAAIVEAGNNIFSDNFQQHTQRTERGTASVIETLDVYSEAEYVLRVIEQTLAGTDWHRTHHDKASLAATSFSDFAVLYRTRRQGKLVAEKLRAAGLPVQMLGEESPYATPLARLFRALITYVFDQNDYNWSIVERLATTARIKLRKAMFKDIDISQSPTELVSNIAVLLDRQEESVVLQLQNMAARFKNMKQFQEYLESMADQAFFDPAADAVILSTIHASKGLEFRHVLVIGCNDGVLPSKRADDLAEERRLFYVAVTRARDSLTVLYTQKRNKEVSKPSQFLTLLKLPHEIDKNLAEIKRKRQRSHQKHAQQSLFSL